MYMRSLLAAFAWSWHIWRPPASKAVLICPGMPPWHIENASKVPGAKVSLILTMHLPVQAVTL